MTFDRIPSGPWTPANSLQQLTTLIDRINELQAYVASIGQAIGGSPAGSFGRPAAYDIFLGYTATTPPGGSPGTTKYTDARYYTVRSVAPAPTGTAGNYSKLGALIDNLSINDDPFNGHSQLPTYVTATNLAELPAGYKDSSTNKGSHGLPDNTTVLVIGFPSRQNPLRRTYVMVPLPIPNGLFRVALTQTGGSGTAGWTYTAKSLDGNVTWGTTLTPEEPHWGNTNAATFGDGYVDSSGTFKLAYASEGRTPSPC